MNKNIFGSNNNYKTAIKDIERKNRLETELAETKREHEVLARKVDVLRAKYLELNNAITGLNTHNETENSFSDPGRERLLREKRAEFDTVKFELRHDAKELSKTALSISLIEQDLNNLFLTVSITDIVGHQKAIADEQLNHEALGNMLAQHEQEMQHLKIISDSAAPLVEKQQQLLIDAGLGTDNQAELAQITADALKATEYDAAINAKNQKQLAEKATLIAAINTRLSNSSNLIAELKDKHRQLLGGLFSAHQKEQFAAVQQAAHGLIATMKTAKALDEFVNGLGVNSNTLALPMDFIFSIERMGLLDEKHAPAVKVSVADEVNKLKEQYAKQGVIALA